MARDDCEYCTAVRSGVLPPDYLVCTHEPTWWVDVLIMVGGAALLAILARALWS